MPPVAAAAAAAAVAVGSAVSAGVAAVGAGLATAGAAVGITGGLSSIATGALLVGSATQLVGAVTGSKTLSRIGGFMSMAGGVGTLAGMAGGAAQAAGGAAKAAKAAGANSQYGLNMGSKFAAQQGAPIGLLGGGTGNVSMPTIAGMPQLSAEQVAQAVAPTAGQQGSSPSAAAPATPSKNPLTRAEELLTKYDRTADILGGMADAYMDNSARKSAIKERQKDRDFEATQNQIDRDRAGATIKTQNLRSLLQNTRF